MVLRKGTRLGPYEILALLGAGGMGEVYRARDSRLRREVAIKVPPDHLSRDPAALARFEREARAVAALSHPNILEIHDFGNEGGICFAVTELLRGQTLRHQLTGVPLSWRRAVEIGLAIADGLAAAHGRGVVHRDLKPENIFLTSDERVKILDFGLARLDPEKSATESSTRPTATETGTLMGTAGYMSPEQVRGKRADARSDIFSLGCILYEMVTGRRAFSGETSAETLVAILKEEPKDPGDLVEALPGDLRLLILRCLAKNPGSRFQSAQDLGFALRVAGTATATPPTKDLARHRLIRPALVLAGAVGVALLVVLGMPFLSSVFSPARGPIDSVAVLPFANASNDPNAEYLSDGITESLINSLSQLPDLLVIARTTSFRYKGEADPLKAGRDLGVRAVVIGRVLPRGDNLVVKADLIDVERGSQLWGGKFEKAADVFAVEAIAQEISGMLRLNLSGEQKRRLAKRYTDNAEAYELYLRGRHHWNRRTPDAIEQSIEYYDQAIARDPNYALAFAGLADSYGSLAFYGWRPPKEILPEARKAARRALDIDETIAEAHATLADVLYQFERDWAGAEREFRRAIELNPNYPSARQWYSNFLSVSGRFGESFDEIRKAQKLDPLNIVINMDVGTAFYWAGQYDRAIEELRQTLELEPKFPLTHMYLGLVQMKKGLFDVAIEEFETAVRLSERDPNPIALYGYACAKAGRRQEAEESLKELQALSSQRFVSAFPIAFLYLGLDNKEKTFEWLEKAYEERAGRLVYLKVERAFDPLRSDPRFEDLLRRLKFPS